MARVTPAAIRDENCEDKTKYEIAAPNAVAAIM